MKKEDQPMQAFLEALYTRYKKPLLGIVRRYLGSSEDCEDVFHEVFIRIVKNAPMLSTLPEPKLEAYLILVARGVSIDYLRKSRKNESFSMGDDVVLSLLEGRKPSDLNAFGKVDLSIMMDELPPEEKLLLIGKYYLGLSTQELVKIVGGTATGVRSRLHRARKKVLAAWSEAGLRIGDFVDE